MNEVTNDTAFLRLLSLVENRPGMYLGDGGLEHLACLLNGWRLYKVMNSIDDRDRFAEAFFREFHGFVASHYGAKHSTVGWFTDIASRTKSSETAVKVFFDLLRRFHTKFLADTHDKDSDHES